LVSVPQRFRFGSEDLWVVPRRDVTRVDNESRARAVVRELAQEPGALEAMLREAGIDPMPGTTEGDAEAELVRALASGRVVLVRTDEMPRLGRPSRGLGHRDDPDAPITPMKEPTFLGVTVLHESGAGYPGAIFNLALPAGELRTVTLDANSSFRLDDIPDKGTCRMRPFRHRYELTDEMRARAGAPVVTRADDVRARVGEDAGVGLRTGAEHRVVVADVATGCVRIVGMSFALNKAFLLPTALEGIRLVKHMYDKYEGAEILLVGHTDTSGKPGTNASLSLQRAEAVSAFLRDDVDAWLDYYGSSTKPKCRWGPQEDLAMLAALPHGGPEPHYSPDHALHSLPEATRRFQAANGLADDAIMGPVTRRELVRHYMAADRTSLPPDTVLKAHGCGESFLEIATDKDVVEPKNRRVEIFFFRRGIDPAPAASASDAGNSGYPQWRESVEEERTFTPRESGLGTITFVTDIPTYYAEASGVRFRLEATDGSYTQVLSPLEDGVDQNGDVALRFVALPRGSFFTLVAAYADGTEDEVFADIPYLELFLLSAPRSDDIVDPLGFSREGGTS
jgi:outer membrane protein OmpA-like peptidoglycan-associated protein